MSRKALVFEMRALPICACPVQGEGLGCSSAGPDPLPLDSPYDLQQVTSPGFVKSWDYSEEFTHTVLESLSLGVLMLKIPGSFLETVIPGLW